MKLEVREWEVGKVRDRGMREVCEKMTVLLALRAIGTQSITGSV